VRDIEAYVLGVVDLGKEREKLGKQREKLDQQISGLAGKLGNEGFVAKAPPDVVARERARLEDLQRQLESLDAALRAL
jgi:valyl-tRNA synthetase